MRSMKNAALKKFQPERFIRINGNTYKLKERLGEGGFAYVFRVKANDGLSLALKKIMTQTDEQRQVARREIEAYKEIENGPGFAHLHDSEVSQDETFLLLSLFPRTWAAVGKSEAALQHSIVTGVVEALCYLHDVARLVLRDLKRENVCLDAQGQPHLIDLGSTAKNPSSVPKDRKALLRLSDHISSTVSKPYCAPELLELDPGSSLTDKSDLWSLGICIFEAVSGGTNPFVARGGSIELAINSGKYDDLDPNLEDSAFWSRIIAQCLELDTELRVSASDLLLLLKMKGSESNNNDTSFGDFQSSTTTTKSKK